MKRFVVDKKGLEENIKTIMQKAGDKKVIAVLKGNGYGLGLIEFAGVLKDSGIDFFAVADIAEGIALREAGFDCEILLLSSVSLKADADLIVKHDIIASVGSIDAIEQLDNSAGEQEKTARAHIKIDTGFGRFGFLESEYESAISALKAAENIEVCGIFSHFSFSFAKNRKSMDRQLLVFKRAIEVFKEGGIDTCFAHIANSSAFLKYPDTYFDAVRVGSAFLGRVIDKNGFMLNKIGYLTSEVAEIKTLPKGHNIGYANTYKTKRQTKIAVVPVGYIDGFGVSRSKDTFRLRDMARYLYTDIMTCLKTKHLTVKISDKTLNLLGRVGMYNIIVDITGTDVKVGDIVEIDINPLFCDSAIMREYI